MVEPYPTGARDSFIATLFVAVIVLIILSYRSREKKEGSLKKQLWVWLRKDFWMWLRKYTCCWLGEDFVIRGSLLAVTFLALWLTIRVTLFHGRLYLFDEDYNYHVFQLLDILAYVLAINLCMTLLRAPREPKEIVSATMQSVLLALLMFLPRATSIYAIGYYGQYGSAVILVGFSALLTSLVYTYTKILGKKEKK